MSKNKILVILITLTIGLTLFFTREIFFYQYEPEYYENLYYQSQWNVPQSTRGISDGELYKFVGYRLTQGENPFYINYEIPPLGKHLYGIAERLTGNPFLVSLGLYLGSIGIFYLLAKQLFTKQKIRLLSLLLLTTTPFIATQIRETMLDLPLMFMYLTHTYFIIRYFKTEKLIDLLPAAVFLGLATGVKPGVYTPFVLLLDLIFIYWHSKDIKNLLLYIPFTFGGYVLAFASYFIRHPNPIPWLRLHKKPLEFYLSSQASVEHLNQWKGIFLNIYQGWWQPGNTVSLGDWTLLLPVGVIAALIVAYKSFKNKNKPWLYLSLLVFIFLIVNTFIPFWSRYLMPIIPLFVLLSVYLFQNKKWLIVLLILLNLPFMHSSLVKKDLAGHTQAVARFISIRAYRELYRSTTPSDINQIPETDFIQATEGFLDQLSARDIQVEVKNIEIDKYQAIAQYEITYQTRFGPLTHQKDFQFRKVRNQWKLDWDWDYVWTGFTPQSELVIDEDTIPVTRLENNAGELIASRGKWKTVYVIPRLMYDWNKHIDALAKVTGLNPLEVDRRVKKTTPSDYPRFVGYLDPSKNLSIVEKQALEIKGVSLRPISFVIAPQHRKANSETTRIIYQALEEQPSAFDVRADIKLTTPQAEDEVILRKDTQSEDFVYVLE